MSSNNPYGAQWDEGGSQPPMPGPKAECRPRSGGSSRRRTDTRRPQPSSRIHSTASSRVRAAADGWRPVQRVWVHVRTLRSRPAANRMGRWSPAWPVRRSAPRVRPSTNSTSAETAEEQNQNLDHRRGGSAGGDPGGRRRHGGNRGDKPSADPQGGQNPGRRPAERRTTEHAAAF